MGGQACVLYGAAEFSRDLDLAILADLRNLGRLRKALLDLKAEPIAVPPFDIVHLRAGHAVHFRCHHPEADQMRLDIMSRMRGVDSFRNIWKRRTSVRLEDGTSFELLSLPDLVAAKKTQRDKDWPMIRRLVEAHYFQHIANPSPAQIRFWLHELRTPELLFDLACRYPKLAARALRERGFLREIQSRDLESIGFFLGEEEAAVREEDRGYWAPLKKELEAMRASKVRNSSR